MNKIKFLYIILILSVFTTISHGEGIIETKSGLKYEDILIGDGLRAVPGKVATIHLIMWKDMNGIKGERLIDSYQGDSNSITFKLGTQKITDGLNMGVTGMRVGGKRRLYVPFNLSPKTKSGPFPGNTDLIFEVELIEIK